MHGTFETWNCFVEHRIRIRKWKRMSSSESAHQEATNTGDSVSTNAGSRDGDSPGNHGNQPDKDKDNANNDERSTIHDRKGSPTECIEIPVENSGGSGGSQTLLRRRRSSVSLARALKCSPKSLPHINGF